MQRNISMWLKLFMEIAQQLESTRNYITDSMPDSIFRYVWSFVNMMFRRTIFTFRCKLKNICRLYYGGKFQLHNEFQTGETQNRTTLYSLIEYGIGEEYYFAYRECVGFSFCIFIFNSKYQKKRIR